MFHLTFYKADEQQKNGKQTHPCTYNCVSAKAFYKRLVKIKRLALFFSNLRTFILKLIILSVCLQRSHRPTDPEEVTNEALRTMCDNTLHLLTTTVGRLADVRRLSTLFTHLSDLSLADLSIFQNRFTAAACS